MEHGKAIGAMPPGYAANVKAAQQNTFDKCSEAFESMRQLVGRLEGLADKMLGPTPIATGLTDNAQPNGLLPVLGDSADKANARLREGFEALTRIERALP